MKNLLAIAVVWIGCSVAWVILGATVFARSESSFDARGNDVTRLWGPPQVQSPPRALYWEPKAIKEKRTTTDSKGQVTETEHVTHTTIEHSLPLQGSDLRADIDMEHRRKGLNWFPTYGVQFSGRYTFRNDTKQSRDIELRFPLSKESAIYDGFSVTDENGVSVPFEILDSVARWQSRFSASEAKSFAVRYKTRGTKEFRYYPHTESAHPASATDRREGLTQAGTTEVRNFRMLISVDAAGINFPEGSISPTRHGPTQSGWQGEWAFESLISNADVGIELPQRTNPGPLAARITLFAPVGLLFFFAVVVALASVREKSIHPINFFFFGAAFFAFHLLFAYLVDHVSIALAFAIASAASSLLVTTYAQYFVGWRFAMIEIGVSQVVYLVLFSLTFLLSGFTGLAIAVGAVLTLLALMHVTGASARARARAVRGSGDPVAGVATG